SLPCSPHGDLPLPSWPEPMAMELHTLAPNTCIIRDTASRRGRTQAIAPGSTPASRHLHYGRLILQPGDSPIRIETRTCETGFVGLKGSATATVDGASYTIDRYDALYVPRETAVTIAAGAAGRDLAEIG